MEWATLQTGLPALISALLEIPCDFAGQPRTLQQGPRAQLDIIAIAGIGVDEETWDADGTEPNEMRETVHGLRELTLQVDVWNAEQTLERSARRYLEQLRTRIRWTSSKVALRELGLGVIGFEDVVQLDPIEDGRRVSRASMDIRLAYGTAETDEGVPSIETFRLQSDPLRGPDGTEHPLQVDVGGDEGPGVPLE
jgi:hypothetical protein